MANRLIVQKRALREFDEAYEWYQAHEPGLGLRFAYEVDAAFELIREHPDLFAPIHRDIRRVTLKHFPYSVYYVQRNESVKVVAVMHGARHPRNWQRRGG